ncbi:hypothetical protein TNCV_105321 [Trichonephila clavipes]|nr:hypothetical protein TNCV_105321 [Trichonephila clavipes]
MPPQETFSAVFLIPSLSPRSVFFRNFGVCVPCNNNICKLENFWRCYYLKPPFPSPPPIETAPSEKHLVLSCSPMPIKGTAGFKSAILPPLQNPPVLYPLIFPALSDSCTCLIRLCSLLRKNEALPFGEGIGEVETSSPSSRGKKKIELTAIIDLSQSMS